MVCGRQFVALMSRCDTSGLCLLPTLWITQDVGAGGGSNRVLRITHNPSVNLGTIRKALLIYMLAGMSFLLQCDLYEARGNSFLKVRALQPGFPRNIF